MTRRNLGHLINLFFMTNRSLHKHLQAAKIVTTLSFLQFIALKYVLDEGTVRMKDIARFMSITPASATALVDGLVKMRVLERITDHHDRRIVLLRATQGGRKKLDDTENLAKRELKKIFEKLSETDRDTMIAVLEKLSDILDKQKPASVAGRMA